ncbi:MAG TPA: LapA family protein [Actinomycetes bacterium]|nr:LapA family protein [Actinomycetes bacterium]
MNEHESSKSGVSGKGDGSEPSGWRPRLTPSLVLWSFLALIALVLLAQNTEQTEVDFFGWRVTAPLFLVIGGSLLIGWGLGELGTRVWRWRRRDR